ncbi:MAG TPA: hypothetical protein VNG71_21530 [Pyrinomonadaceae bacterium]|nr:hypothetical protein [Pyrinomonadaceae bacterium]
MAGFLLLIGSALAGLALVRRLLGQALRFTEQLFWGIAVGWVLSSAGGYLLARVLGRLSFGVVLAITLAVWLFAGLLLLRELRHLKRIQFKHAWQREHTGLAIVLLILTPIIWKVFSAQMFAAGNDGIYSGGSSLYDLSFHATVASSFAYGANFPPIYTAFPPEPLLYPPLPDFHAAMLMTTGWSLRPAFIFTALPLAISFTGLLYFLALCVARSARAATIATLLFCFNGGFGFIYFVRDWRASGRGLLDMLSAPPVNYCNDATRGLYWVNTITDVLAPQRTTVYALPVALMILTLFASLSEWFGLPPSKNERREVMLFLIAGTLTGSLCYLQPHVGIAIGIVAIGLCLLRPGRAWIVFFITAALVSAPFLISTLGHATTSGFMRFQPGWLGRDEPHQIIFWLRNLGLPLLLVIPAYVFAPRVLRKFYLPFVIVMLVAVLFVLSPNDYDNLKLMVVWCAATSILIATWLARLTRRKWLTPVVALVVLLCVASGLLAVRRGMSEHDLMFTNEQTQAADYVRQHTAPRSLILTAPVFHQPVLSLAGRPIVRGVADWLWSHGYNFQEREADVRRIYAGAPDADELIRYYQIDYVYLGDAETSDLKANASFFEGLYPRVYRSSSIAIYDTRGDRSSVGALEKPPPREPAARIDVDPYALLHEFPRTSFFAYRILKASSGHVPTRAEFMNAMKQLGRGLYVGAPGWEAQLDLNRTALLKDCTESSEFRGSFDGRSHAEFVDALSKNTGRELSKESRDAVINRLNAGESRASVLQDFAEDREFSAREYNNAYVLMHFFGYLGRNPGEPPDHDLSGFNFWVSVLDKTSDYRAISRAFLNSSEYKERPVR